jgi:hypothetical protein
MYSTKYATRVSSLVEDISVRAFVGLIPAAIRMGSIRFDQDIAVRNATQRIA